MSLYDELADMGEKNNDSDCFPGLAVGVVRENWDKDHPGKLKVELMLGEKEKNVLDWISVASPYAGKEFGAYLLPEIGDQVLVGFVYGRIKSAYVIGCLWNQTNTLPKDSANEKNTQKIFLTKGGNQICISDEKEKEKISILTKGGLKIEMDDENQKINIQDKEAENEVKLDAKNGAAEFTLKKKVLFKVNGKEMLVLDGEGKKVSINADTIGIEAGQKLQLKGQNTAVEGSSMALKGQDIKIESQAALALKGTASLKAESSGMAEIKGTMLKLN